MLRDRPAIRPTAVEIVGWVVDGLVVLALCVAASKAHRSAFGFFAAFAVVGFATRVHWTGVYVVPSGLRTLIALLYLASSTALTAEAFDLLSGLATDAARWGFTAACAIMLGARIVGWRAVVIPTDATE